MISGDSFHRFCHERYGIHFQDNPAFAALPEHQQFELLMDHFHIPEHTLLTDFAAQFNAPINLEALPEKDPLCSVDECAYGVPLFYSNGRLYVATNRPLLVPETPHTTVFLVSTPQLHTLQHPKTGDDPTLTPMDTLLLEMTRKNASDIHLHRTESGASIFFRIAGHRVFHQQLNTQHTHQLFEQIKYHAHMKLSTQAMPQDGQIQVNILNQLITARVATLPCYYGEEIAIRNLNHHNQNTQLEHLGFTPKLCHGLQNTMHLKSGLFLVTGPTGSGKTTTLYSCIAERIKTDSPQIVSLEDPIERHLDNVRQSQINPSIGYTFETGLKAILRHDPDIIFIGEIRDQNTAQIALEAAYTGHLVISSLHTNTVQNSLIRLQNLGCDPFMLSHALKGILFSQTLVPLKCNHCGGNGCITCQFSGKHGRTAVCEWLDLREWNPKHCSQEELLSTPNNAPFYSFKDDIDNKKELLALERDAKIAP